MTFAARVDTVAPTGVTVASADYPPQAWTAATSGTFTFTAGDAVSGVDHYVYGLDTSTPDTGLPAGQGSVTLTPGDGWHTLSVAAVDRAGNQSAPVDYSFGTTTPAVTSPAEGAIAQATVPLTAKAAPGQTSVSYYWRHAPADAWAPIPPADVDSGGAPIGGWPWTFTSTGDATSTITPALTWHLDRTLDHVTGPAQVAVCFGATCPTTPTATLPAPSSSTVPVDVTLDLDDFGASASADTPVGPVNLATGNLEVSAGDVSITANGATLSVGRSFDSAHPGTPADGIFGPGWAASLPVDSANADWTALSDLGSTVNVTDADQAVTSFAAQPDGGYRPTGDAADSGLTLTPTGTGSNGPTGFTLTDVAGNTTTFAPPAGTTLTAPATTAAPHAFVITTVAQPGDQQDVSYRRDASGQVTQVLAPVPAGVTCDTPTSSWAAGCQGLELGYDTAGHLSTVGYATTDNTGAALTVDVACYAYNTDGRLSSAWDPRDIPTPNGPADHPIVCDGNAPVRPTSYGYDPAGRITSITPAGLAGYQLGYDTAGRLATVTRTHTNGGGAETTTVLYGLTLTPNGASRPDLTTDTVATWAQTDAPTTGAAVCPPGAATPADTGGDLRDCTLNYLDGNGHLTNTADYAGTDAAGWHITTTEYDGRGNIVRTLTAANREEALHPTTGAGAALGLPADPAAAARWLDTTNVYTPNASDGTDDLTDSYGPYHLVTLPDGSIAGARAHTHTAYDTGSELGHPAGGSQHLPVSSSTAASLSGQPTPTNEQDTITASTDYALSATDATGWIFRSPMKTVVDPGGLAVTTITRYDPATGAVIESRLPGNTGGGGAGSTLTTYYTADALAGADPACTNRPAWAGLVCKTSHADTLTPGSANAIAGLPGLVTTWTKAYDYLGRPTLVEEDATPADGGSPIARTTTTSYGFNSDANPYATTSYSTALTGGVGTPVGTTTSGYDPATGLPTSTSNGALSDATGYDEFGRVASYRENTTATGAADNIATTSYDPTSGRVTQTGDAHTTVTYAYDGGSEHRGLPTAMTVTVHAATQWAGSFTAGYDADGALTTQTDPSGVTSSRTLDEAGNPTTLTDTKNGAAWLADTAGVDIYGRWLHHAGATGSQEYEYDAAGRLTSAADTPTAGTGCTTRTYAFDADSNRKSLTTYSPASDGSCQTTTPATTTSHGYDHGDRLTSTGGDTGLSYDTYGRITTLPAADTTGGTLTVGYYANDLVRSQTQGSTTQTWTLDAEGRLAGWTVQNTATTPATTTATKANHYDDPGSDSPAWIAENADASQWTANIVDLTGALAATVDQTGAPTYQYAGLHGDITGTATPTDAAPSLAPDYDEYGNPPAGTTAAGRYGWLGAKRRSTDDLGGLTLMGVRLYNPTLGRFLQTDPIPGGSANAYDYANQDPNNREDLSGRIAEWMQLAERIYRAYIHYSSTDGGGALKDLLKEEAKWQWKFKAYWIMRYRYRASSKEVPEAGATPPRGGNEATGGFDRDY